MIDSLGLVDSKKFDGRRADGRFALKNSALPTKMFFPHVVTRIEQRHDFLRARRMSCDVAPFARVTPGACPTKVLECGRPTMLLRPDVVYFVRQHRATL